MEPIRYDFQTTVDGGEMDEWKYGEYVKYDDYLELLSENLALKKLLEQINHISTI
jgi:hypothetical protein